jgi:hypothetical protein
VNGGYQWPKAAKAGAKTGYWTIETVERSSIAVGSEILPRRWIVERTFAWLSRFRRLARDFERYARTRRLHPPRHDPPHAEAPRCKFLVMNVPVAAMELGGQRDINYF